MMTKNDYVKGLFRYPIEIIKSTPNYLRWIKVIRKDNLTDIRAFNADFDFHMAVWKFQVSIAKVFGTKVPSLP